MFKKMMRDYRKKYHSYTKEEYELFEQYNLETDREALNKHKQISSGFKLWEKDRYLKQKKLEQDKIRQEKNRQEFLEDPSIEKLEELGFTEETEEELDNQILKETLEDMELMLTSIANWIKKRYGIRTYNKFLNFMKMKLKECKHLKFEIKQ